MALFVGIDLGSSSVKCVVVDVRGKVRAQAESGYDFDSPQDGRLEVDPDKWWQLAKSTLGRALKDIDPRQIKGIGLCGVMMMAVMLDRHGNVVRPTLSWLDQRVLPQLDWIKQTNLDEAIFEATGTAISPSQTPLPLLWVKEHEPHNFARIDKVILSKDYIRYKLTGELCTDLTDASGTLFLDTLKGIWNEGLMTKLGIPSSVLPRLVASTQLVGHLLDEVALEIGLPPGLRIPVAAGSGDGVSSGLGLGIVKSGQLGITVGTAGVLMSVSSAFVVDQSKRCLVFQHPAPNLWYLVTATNTSGEAARWFSNKIYKDLPEPKRYARFIEDAGKSQAGSGGLLFLPYLAGSRSPHYDATTRGVFMGLGLHSDLSDLARAVMEGVAYELRDCFEVHRDVLATQKVLVENVRVSGGITRNPLWLQILADILNVPLQIPKATELGAVGAAMNAAIGAAYYTSHEQAADQMVTMAETIEPMQKNQSIYSDGFEFFRLAYPSAKLRSNPN